MQRTEVIKAINSAFDIYPVPKLEELTDFEPFHSPEDEELANFLQGRPWPELVKQCYYNDQGMPIESFSASITMPRNRAFVYYLPAFMLMVLRDPDDDLFVQESIIHSLLNRPVDIFSEDQKKAICLFLRWLYHQDASYYGSDLSSLLNLYCSDGNV